MPTKILDEVLEVICDDKVMTITIEELREKYPMLTSGDLQSMVVAIKHYREKLKERL